MLNSTKKYERLAKEEVKMKERRYEAEIEELWNEVQALKVELEESVPNGEETDKTGEFSDAFMRMASLIEMATQFNL